MGKPTGSRQARPGGLRGKDRACPADVLRGDGAATDRAEAAGWGSRSRARGQHRSDRTREILFVDRGVADFPTILRSLQPGIEAILLERDRPAARQIAAALARRPGLGTLHVIAHGAPGRVSFASGDWSLETLAEETRDFTAIGEALGPDGRLLLWSCRTGAGAAGADFLEGLARKTGADVAAAADSSVPPPWAVPGFWRPARAATRRNRP